MNNITYGVNDLGHKQAFDREGDLVCPDCGRCYKNLGMGTCCESCQLEELDYCERNYQDMIS